MWKPILDPSLQAKAFPAIDAIATALLAKREDRVGRTAARTPTPKASSGGRPDASLAGGTAGISILYAYLSRALTASNYNEVALRFLTEAAAAVSAVPMNRSLFGGFTGVAWSVVHLRTWLLDPDDHSTEPIDKILQRDLGDKAWRGLYDLVSGLVGFGIYGLEQLPRPVAIECLIRVVDRLDETAERGPQEITWFTPRDLLPQAQREMHPKGHYDLGLAHGVPGVVAFLGRVCSLNVRSTPTLAKTQAKARLLLNGAVPWLLAQKLKPRRSSVFPSFTGPGVHQTSSRVAWCYGDLGIAAALLSAAQSLKKAKWKEEALRLARNVARRPPSESGVRDCGLCHGAVGVAHIFNRLFQATGEPLFKRAALSWFECTLRMRHASQGIAGFFALEPGPEGRLQSTGKTGLLDGATGVALALLAAATDVEPNWDRIMLLSLPTQRGRSRAARDHPTRVRTQKLIASKATTS